MRPILDGVPQTTLWTLHNRAAEACRPGGRLHDPLAVELRERIDHPYRENFGTPSQTHPLRARAFDTEIRAHLRRHPGGTVVALGEGLQTTFWRVGDPSVRWLSVDLPPIVALRRELLPGVAQMRHLACSALDRRWMDEVGAVDPASVLLTAEGLLMYFEPADVDSLLADCAARFPGACLLADTIPPWLSRRTLRGLALTPSYTAPAMPFGTTVTGMLRLADRVPGVVEVRELSLPSGRLGFRAPVPRVVCALPWLGDHRPAMFRVAFLGGSAACER